MSNNVIVEPGIVLSHIENEEYFPLRVVYNSSIESVRFIGFYYKDIDLLELTVDRETGLVRQLQIVVCSHFQFVDKEYLPENADDARIYFNYAQHIDCDIFSLTVFKNAVQIIVSDKTASVFSRCGQAIYGISSSGELISILVANMSVEDIAHTKAELSICIEQTQEKQVIEYGDWVRCDGQIMYVQDSSEEKQPGKLGLQRKDAPMVYDTEYNMSFPEIVYYPIEEVGILSPVVVDEQTLRSFFRLETTPWVLCGQELYPFSENSGAFVLTDDDLKVFAANLAKADGIIMDDWTDQFVFRNRKAHVQCPKGEKEGLSLELAWCLVKSVFSWFDIEEDEPEEITEVIDLYLASKDKPLDEIDFPYSVKSELISAIEDSADEVEATEERRRAYIRLLDELCGKGDRWAIEHKAYAYYGGNKLVPCDWRKSEQALLQLEETGDSYAANSLGYIYYSDRLGEADYDKAFYYFSKAAKAGIVEARYKLSDLYRKGHGTQKDPDKAFSMLQKVYEEQLASFQDGYYSCKYADTALRMGYCYEEGSGCEQDFHKAHEYFLRAKYAIDLRISKSKGFGDEVVRKNIETALERSMDKDTGGRIEITDLPGYPLM